MAGSKENGYIAEKHVEVSVGNSAGLRSFCNTHHRKLLDVLQTAWVVAFGLFAGNAELPIEYLAKDQDSLEHDVQDTNGCIEITHRFKSNPQDTSTLLTLIKKAHAKNDANGEFSAEKDLNRHLFDTDNSRTLIFSKSTVQSPKHAVTVSLRDCKNASQINVTTNVPGTRIHNLTAIFENVLRCVLENPDCTIGDLQTFEGRLQVWGLERSARNAVKDDANHEEASAAFWTQQLRDENTACFPTLPDPQYQPKADKIETQEIPLQSVEGDISATAIFHAAWALVSAQFTDSKNVTFGRRSSTPGSVSIPVQVPVDYDLPIEEFLRQLQRQLEDMAPFKSTPLQNIRQLSPTTVVACDFQTEVVIDIAEEGVHTLGDKTLRKIEPTGQHACALTLKCLISPSRVILEAQFDEAVITSAQLNWVLRQLKYVIKRITADTAKDVGEAAAINPEDEEQIFEWNKRIPPFVEKCVHHTIQERAAAQPDAPAVYAWDGQLSYAELDALSTKLGHHLRSLGVRPETFVPFCFEKSMWTVVTVMGIMKAGGVGVPLEPAHPNDRKLGMIEDVKAKIVLCSQLQSESCTELCAAASSETRLLVVSGEAMQQLPVIPEPVCEDVRPNNAVYLIFTSGSTGKPKGVVWEHRTLSSSIAEHGKALFFERKPRVLQFAAYVFDISVSDTFTTLSYGGCICIPSDHDRVNNIAGFMNDAKVNWAFFTPTFARLIKPADVPGLKTLVMGGEKIGQDNVDNWRHHLQLLVVYGPAETCIYCSGNEVSIGSSNASNIGKTFGGRLWITDSADVNKLLPIGVPGEIIIEGPILARGYLNDPEKTKSSFVMDPSWARIDGKSRRFYRTGDLGKYTPDGTIAIIGRKDNQVKMRGQRMELGEVEHHLVHNDLVKHALAMVPQAGPYQGRLTVTLTLTSVTKPQTSLQVISETRQEEVAAQVSKLREYLTSKLPIYMVPTVWVPVDDIPLTLSRKLDRMEVKRWITSLDQKTLDKISAVTTDKTQLMPTSPMEKKLQEIWSRVLNVPLQKIGANSSFLKLGGDSITAIQVTSRCRSENIEVTVQDILRCKILSQLALKARVLTSEALDVEEEVGTEFALNPIQKWHMRRTAEVENNVKNHFNQSFILRLGKHVRASDLKRAIEILLAHHSMLRSRFKQSSESGQWTQHISTEITDSYRLRVHDVSSMEAVEPRIHQTQRSFDLQNGPLFGADLINIAGASQLLFLAVQHVVIDLVSWRIIMEDLEAILTSGVLSAPKSLPFSTWIEMQTQYGQQHIKPAQALPFDIRRADFDYWGMAGRPNLAKDSIKQTISIPKEISTLILGACNEPLKTDPVDLLLSAVIHSFGQIFIDRAPATVFNEGHGREPWDASVDVSRTVGWFTIMSPISIPGSDIGSIVQVVKETKDARHRIPKNGWEYFTSRHLTSEGAEAFGHHDQMEILFNYFGIYQQLERKDGLLNQVPAKTFNLGDVSPSMPEWALFEVEVGVEQGELQFTFAYNRFMRHQDRISSWVKECKTSLETLVKELSKREPEFTISDFPMLSLDYPNLDTLVKETLPQLGLENVRQIEDIYPCSPMQEGILVAQTKQAGHYKVEDTFKISPKGAGAIDVMRLENAWKQVVARHAILRTICMVSLSQDSNFQQVVLENFKPRVFHVRAKDHAEALRILKNYTPVDYNELVPGHRFGICQLENGDTYFRLEVNHTLIDATSTQNLCKEIGLAYDGLLPNITAPSYSEYISYIHRQPAGLALGYWKTYLANVKYCRFPTLNDGDIRSPGELKTVTIPFHNAALVDSFCKVQGVTHANVISTVWGLLLQSYTGESDVCFGYLASGRDLPIRDVQDIVGPLINMVISRVTLPDTEPVLNVLEKVQADYISASPHQVCSLAEVYHALDLAGEKLFNTAISLEKKWSNDLAADSSVAIEEIDLHDPTDFDLVLNVAYSSDEFRAAITYNASCISDKHALNIADTLDRILTSVLESPGQVVADVERLGIQNVKQLLAWNDNLPGPLEKCVHDAVHEQALLYPDQVAISSWDGELSYAELDDMSTRFSHYLAKLGVTLEMVVPLAFEKSRWVIVSQLGVLKAGGACLTMDMSHPTSRLQGMCKQVEAKLMLAAPDCKDRLKDTGVHMVVVDEAFIRSLPAQSTFACTTVKPNNMGFIVFTSGSTGNPKGIMLEHKTVCTSSRGHQAVFDVGPGSRCLQFSAFAFDVHISDIFTPLMYGGCCCVPSEKERMDNLAEAIRKSSANRTYITPTVATLFRPEDVPSLKKVALGGEPLTQENAKTWGGKVHLINVFGPSETSNWVSYRHVLPNTTQPSNIGPGVDVNIWLVDHLTNTHLVPIGCVGEMFVEGPILARGYINDPAKTAAAFIENPPFLRKYGGGSGRRFYGTGDLVRANSDGSLLYVGRKDSQVKVHGQRLELGEVEYAISESPDVKHVSVVLPTSGLCKGHLVAVIALKGIDEDHGSESLQILSTAKKAQVLPKLSNLIDGIAVRLAAWMLPHFWAIVNEIPSSASSKLDRGRVKQFIANIDQQTLDKISALTVEDQLEMPTTAIEKKLRDAWSRTLKIPVDQIGVNSSFLRLGGDSLSIMRLTTEARSHGIVLSTAAVFRHPKLRDMALVATGGESETLSEVAPFSLLGETSIVESIRAEAAVKCNISIDLIEDIYPCTPLQEGLMALSIAQPGTYIAQSVYKLPSTLDFATFRKAWQQVYQSNPILRTRVLSTESSGTLQVVVSDEITWSTDTNMEAYLKKDKQTAMLHGMPLSRFAVIEGHFIMTAHHAIYDGWSLGALLEDAVAAYQQRTLESHAPYKFFIKHIQEIDHQAAGSFWISELSNANTAIFPHIPFPKYQPRADTLLVQGVQFSRKPGSEITISTIIQAAWAIVSSQYVNDTNITFGLLLSGRNAPIPGITGMMGPTITTVPIQVSINHDLSVQKFLLQIQNQTIEMMPFEQTGLQKIRRLNAATEAACNFQTQLVIQPAAKDQSGFELLGIDRINDDSDEVLTYALTFECILGPNGLRLNTLFDSEVIPSVQMKRIIQQFAHMIHTLAEEPSEVVVRDVLSINAHDEDEILAWNPVIPEFAEKLVHERIQEQALLYPDAPAICAWDGELTYVELDVLSTRLGHYLRTLGVRPEAFVPFCFEKSKWCIVSILGIMKAGGVCVPLEPNHPITRKQDMVQDVNARILLSSMTQSERCLGLTKQIITVDEILLNTIPDKRGVVCPSLHPRHPVYVIFTSGSTGKPKAVVWEHRTLSSSIAKLCKPLHFDRRPRVLQFASTVFDASVGEIINTLTYGGCLCIPSDTDKTTNIVQYINAMKVDWTFLTPTFARLIRPEDIPTLKTLALGGESIGQDNIRTWSNKVQLINAYGPSECCILTTTHEFSSPSQSPAAIGRAVGGLVWIVDPNDADKLVPIGAVGEILIEGPTLAIGYLHSPEKTANSFIFNPKWSQHTRPAGCQPGQDRRFYKTGDLGKYDIDGTISFIGRKDNQVKIRGQRMELGEVEHNLMHNSLVQHATVVVPSSGICQGQLVAVVTLSARTNTGELTPLQILSDDILPTALLNIQEDLTEKLPSYMIPSIWLPVEDLPQTTTGKLDRVTVKEWVNNISQKTLDTINGQLFEKSLVKPRTPTERIIQEVWSHVLNIPIAQIGTNSAFLKLGGDSISAIQVASRCRVKNVGVTVPDILRYKTLSELAKNAKALNSELEVSKEELDVPFDLSPIQQMHIEQLSRSGSEGPKLISEYFNQSFLLQINRYVTVEDLRSALHVLVGHHSMLRARFEQSTGGKWSQVIKSDVSLSFHFGFHHLLDASEMESIIAKTQASLDIGSGPLFGADLFNIGDDQQLFITANHLIIDLVSWRIILQDLEEFLVTESLSSPQSTPFQSWITMQAEYTQQIVPVKALPFEIPEANWDYWGMADQSNLVRDLQEVSFSIGKEHSVRLLSSANEPLNTEPLDLFLSAIFYAFAQTFDNRTVPAIFNESHGREPWDSSIDLSRTVGWFTTLSPITIDSASDIVHVVRQVKDTRRKIPQNGWSYFTSRFLTTGGRRAFASHDRMEIVFNYSGQYQQLERQEAILSQSALNINLHEQSSDLEQAGLFNIGVGVSNGELQFLFTYNRHMKHQDQITSFISRSQDAIEEISRRLPNSEAKFTLSDFPLIPLEYSHLDILVSDLLPKLDIQDRSEVEDFYPCAPMQEGILIAQSKEPELYKVENMFKISSLDGRPVDTSRFERAWEKVVKRHSILRTVFIPNILDNNRMFQQLVLKDSKPRIYHIESNEDKDALHTLKEFPSINYAELRPGHRLGIYKSQDRLSLYCRLEISHALIDATATRLICKEMVLAYDDQLLESRGPLYSDYIAYIEGQTPGEALDYWTKYLKDIKPCHMPGISSNGDQVRELRSVDLSMANAGLLHSFCKTHDVTAANVIRAAWALVLQAYTGEDSVCFGYLASGRDLPIPDAAECIGPMINMLICRVDLNASESIIAILKRMSEEYISSLPHQVCSLAEIQHAVGFGSERLFNTGVSIQKSLNEEQGAGSSIGFQQVGGYDPSDFELVLNATYSDDTFAATMTYATNFISDVHARNIEDTFKVILGSLLESADQNVANIKRFGDHNLDQISQWNSAVPPAVDDLVHHRFKREVRAHPESQAVCAWDGELTYRELDILSTRLALYLRNIGIKPEQCVPFCFEKSMWTIVAVLAIVKAGGVCVPLEPDHPFDRKKGMVEDTEARILLASEQQSERCVGLADRLVVVSAATAQRLPIITADDMIKDICSGISATSPIYIIFTSGSTGKPKGVVWEHRNFSSGIAYHEQGVDLRRQPRVIQFAPHVFDCSAMEILTTICLGGCVCVPSDKDKLTNFVDYVNVMNVNWAFLTPTFARLINPLDIPNLRTLVLGGEPIGQDNVDKWSPRLTLLNGFGPSETTICCSARVVIPGSPASLNNVGHPVGCRIWITDVADVNKLLPIGAVGEILIEGPILARGYLHNDEKTAESFVHGPGWASNGGVNRPRRFYRTGDLGKYEPDGTLVFIGRKDNQIKVRGQRMDLGEVEHHLRDNDLIENAVVVAPKEGACKGKLVVVFTILGLETEESSTSTPLQLISHLHKDKLAKVSQLRDHLSEKLPTYMVPNVWCPVQSIPMTTTRKLDRVEVMKWMIAITQQSLDEFNNLFEDGRQFDSNMTSVEKRLRAIWADVLNLPLHQVTIDKPFLNLGGDSITAIQIHSKCRMENINITVPDILRHKTISKIALLVDTTEDSKPNIKHEEVLETPFSLSPIQKTYIKRLSKPGHHFNQSFLVQLNRRMSPKKVHSAIQTIIEHHSMLRARFVRPSHGSHEWTQVVTKDVQGSCWVEFHENVPSVQYIDSVVSHSQTRLDIESGPLFRADLFNLNPNSDILADNGQLLFLTAHHLVIDLVSWRIILQDLEDILVSGALSAPKPLPFQSWVNLQSQYANEHIRPERALPFEVPKANYSYWGMTQTPNLVKDTIERSFSLSQDQTSLILGSANESLNTEPLDLLIAATLYAFAQTFTRQLPAIFNEGHGRETWDTAIDLSRTVGWFTTFFPISVDVIDRNDIVQIVRQVKDTRLSVPKNGWSYMASRFLTPEGGKKFAHHDPEIVFNYTGNYQQLERKDGLLSQASLGIDLNEQAAMLEQTGLFNIGSGVIQGALKFSFGYSRHMRYQSQISKWVLRTKDALATMTERLVQMKKELTLGDLPHLHMSYPELNKLLSEVRFQEGIGEAEIETITPATDYQAESLAATLSKYRGDLNYLIFEIEGPLDISRLEDCCRSLVQRHPILRTVFVANQKQLFQVVLESGTVDYAHYQGTPHTTSQPSSFIVEDMENPIRLGAFHLRFMSVEHGKDHSSLIIKLPHAQFDSVSMGILIHDLQDLYAGRRLAPPSTFSEYLEYKDQNKLEAERYWASSLSGSSITQLLKRPAPAYTDCGYQIIERRISPALLQAHSIDLGSLLKGSWAVLLAQLSGTSDVVFGDLVNGRNAPVKGIEKLSGVCVNTVPFRVTFREAKTVLELLRQINDRQLASMPYEFLGTNEIINRCTDWPSWTSFGSVINHRSLPFKHNPLAAEDTKWTAGQYTPKGNATGLVIESHPIGDELHITMVYGDKVFPPSYIEGLLDRLCKLIIEFSEHPDAPIPLSSTDSLIEQRIPIAHMAGPIPKKLSLDIKASDAAIDIVQRVWERTLNIEKDTVLGPDFTLDTPFYVLWGHPIAAAQFSHEYRREGIEISMEDALAAPSMRQQIVLCVQKLRHVRQAGTRAMAPQSLKTVSVQA